MIPTSIGGKLIYRMIKLMVNKGILKRCSEDALIFHRLKEAIDLFDARQRNKTKYQKVNHK